MPSESRDDHYVRTTFLERLAHELRGPAGVTAGALDQMERTLGKEANERLSAQFAMARRGVSRVVRMAERLQRAAQLERGNTPFALVPCDVRGIVESAARTAQVIDLRRGVEVRVASSETPCMAAVDTGWLLSAIGEIAANALRFARALVSVDTRLVDGEVQIVVRDDGPGFTGAPLLQRFEASEYGSGLGLSLPLVSEVLTAHGGRFEILAPSEGDATATGSGAAVLLRLPAWKAPSQ